jgi:outer membrane protein insertion porin family
LSAPAAARLRSGTPSSRRRLVRHVFLLLLVLIVLGPSGPSRGAIPPGLEGKPIREVRFELLPIGAPPIAVDRIAELVRIEAGEPLDAVRLSDALRRLAAEEELASIDAVALPQADGVVLVWRLLLRPRIVAVELRGNRRGELRPTELGRLGIAEGESFRKERLDGGIVSLRRSLDEGGWVDPLLTGRAEPAGPGRVRIVIEAASGPPTVVGSVEIEDLPDDVDLAAALKQVGLGPGRRLRPDDADAAAGRLRKLLVSAGHLEARPTVAPLSSAKDGATRIVLHARSGPRWSIRRAGVDDSLLSDAALVDRIVATGAEEGTWKAMARDLRNELQKKGFPEPVVRIEEKRIDGSAPALVLAAERGEGRRIGEIAFPGASSIRENELAAVMETTPRGLLGGGIRTDRATARDLAAVTTLYRSRGFFEVAVGPVRVEPLGGGRDRLVVPVVEGPRAVVASVRIEGVGAAGEERLLPLLGLVAGKPWDPDRLAEDQFRLKSFHSDRGHVEVRVETDPPAFSEDRTAVSLVHHVVPGPTVLIDRVLVRGNTFTKRKVIDRLARLRPGDPLSLRRLVEAQQALTRSGLFGRVRVEPVGPEGRSRRDVLVSIEEGRPIALSWGVGLEYDPNAENRMNPRGSLGIRHENLFGTGRLVGLEGRVSAISNRIALTWREPSLFGTDFPLVISIFRGREERQSISTTLVRRGMFVDTSLLPPGPTRLGLRYEYQVVEPRCTSSETECSRILGSLDRQDAGNAIASLGPSLVVDRRDDPFEPRSGTYLGFDGKYAFSLFDADAELWKLSGQAAAYHPLGPFVIGASVRAGAIEPLHRVTNAEGLPNKEIPIPERFFAGGRSTHRAFALDELGVAGQTLLRDETGRLVPIGGNALLLASVEIRFPLFSRLEGALFSDAGNVWSEPSRVRTNELRYGAGFGLRYRTPVGPLRVDYAWKIDREPGESTGELSVSIGYPF